MIFDRVLCALDGSRESLADAHAAARRIIQRSNQQPTLAFTVGHRVEAEVRCIVARGGDPEVVSRRSDNVDADNVDVDSRRPAPALLAASRDAQPIIVGVGDRRRRSELGTVGERVAHRASCPVLVVTEPDVAGVNDISSSRAHSISAVHQSEVVW